MLGIFPFQTIKVLVASLLTCWIGQTSILFIRVFKASKVEILYLLWHLAIVSDFHQLIETTCIGVLFDPRGRNAPQGTHVAREDHVFGLAFLDVLVLQNQSIKFQLLLFIPGIFIFFIDYGIFRRVGRTRAKCLRITVRLQPRLSIAKPLMPIQ